MVLRMMDFVKGIFHLMAVGIKPNPSFNNKGLPMEEKRKCAFLSPGVGL
jgi:hypothetical protein